MAPYNSSNQSNFKFLHIYVYKEGHVLSYFDFCPSDSLVRFHHSLKPVS